MRPNSLSGKILIGFFACATVLGLASTSGARLVRKSPQESRRVFAVIVADTHDLDTGPASRTDVTRVERLLKQALPDTPCDIQLFTDDDATPEKIRAYFESLPKELSDATLFCYYSGHGMFDDVDGHVLVMQGQRFVREELIKQMESKKAKLCILLSDCCDQVVATDPTKKQRLLTSAPYYDSSYKPQLKKADDPAALAKMVKGLFLQHEGFADFTASGRKGKALGTAEDGGFFTQAFVRSCSYPYDLIPAPRPRARPPQVIVEHLEKGGTFSPYRIDRDRDGFVNWREFVEFNWNTHMAILYERTSQLPVEAPRSPEELKRDAMPIDTGSETLTVLLGTAEVKTERFGRPSGIGIGRIFVVSKDENEAKAYLQKHYAGRPGVMIATDEADARRQLEQEFERERKRMILKEYRVLEDTIRYKLRPKNVRDMTDKVYEFSPR
jgi:hypothetical protein